MDDLTKQEKMIKYYNQIKETSKNPQHVAYANTMIKRLENNDKLNFHGGSNPIYDRRRKYIYKNLDEAAAALSVSPMAISKYMESYGLKVINV